jgi:hypothetical protein
MERHREDRQLDVMGTHAGPELGIGGVTLHDVEAFRLEFALPRAQ